METSTLSCRLMVTEDSAQELRLAFEIANDGDRDAELRVFEPFLAFELRVRSDERDVELVQPQLDTPARPRVITIPAHGATLLTTPIRLAFDPAAPPGGGPDPKRWSMKVARGAVTLEATLQLDGRALGPCTSSFLP